MQSQKKNKLIISAAGSGKTTFIVREALRQKGNVLITTYTEANEEEIKRKILKENKCIPANITIQTWFSFLIQHGVKPYQGSVYEKDIRGLVFVNEASGIKFTTAKGIRIPYAEDKEFEKHYFTTSQKVYSDKLSKLVVRCNEKSNGEVFHRISRIYSHIYVDEVQDLAGYDLDILVSLFANSASITLVGDPRQVTYLTHIEKKYSNYRNGKIEDFILDKCKKHNVEIDKDTLKVSHRNNKELCDFSSRLYPSLPVTQPCCCSECRGSTSNHNGVFIVRTEDVQKYKMTYQPIELRYKEASLNEWNIGKAKGLGFERVLVHPPSTFLKYLKTGELIKEAKGKKLEAFDIPKFYVALTRAQFSVAIVYDYKPEDTFIEGVVKFEA